jgi:tyrosine-protein phosphatase YwqE
MFTIFKKNTKSITTLFTDNFVDIHSHLIPGIDDGSKSVEESISLLKKMRSFGIKNFVVTPHIMKGVWENSADTILPKLQLIKNNLADNGLSDITIRAAAEYMLDENFNILLEQKQLLPIKDQLLLIEMSYLNPPVNLYETLFAIQIAGYKPILAHPERYQSFQNNLTAYRKLKNAGCSFQLNLLSLTDYYGKKVQETALTLLKENLIDFVGTDTHNQLHLTYLEKIKAPKIIKLIAPIIENNTILK